ncbi:SpaA isopeptide-forming pilin-related protein [Lactiplantibacillus sp. DA1]|uniref:SpaA isopeptide-forming pilin-related protein n=1 Tax=Lactiplantibacillus sp. DA1 TaxID=3079857 RepID=UPI00292A66D6|nr:SpaA isopeptide-forming pilin-related protein [Lactiplantibacillus sp. DA1]MDV0431470.1 SpaA isopeptide-forming pilin-related protein [Lactiplantibacillus sp. DA1]
MRKKRVGFLLSVLMVILTLFVLGSTVHAKEINVTGLDVGSAKIYDSSGQLMPPSSSLSTNKGYQVRYEWQIPDSEVINAGDTATVEIPTSVMLQGDLTFPVLGPTGETLGTFTYKKGDATGTITFNEALGSLKNREGTLTLNANGNATVQEGERNITKDGLVLTSDANGTPTTLFWHMTVTPGNDPTVIVTDTLGPNQTFLPDSVQAYMLTTVNGTLMPGQPLTPTVAVNGNVVTFSFTNVTGKMAISYKTQVTNAVSNGYNVWHNTASLNGLDVAADADIAAGGSGTATQTYSVQLTKHDAETKAVLAGAIYELQDSTGKVLQSGLTTDVNGQITVKDLAGGTYQFVETRAPAGYELNPNPVTFTLGGAKTVISLKVSQDDQKTPVLPATGDVTLTKTDATTKKALAGAIYELRDANGKVLQSNLKTDATGQLTVTGLTVGDYQFIETMAPTGYQLNATPLPFMIKAGQTAAVTVSATDVPVTNPSQPGEPGTTEPGKPGEPGTTEPGKPGEPGTTEPGKPGEPGTTEPGKPGEPGTTEPGKPGEPGTTEPGKPGEPGTPSEPGTNEPSYPGTTDPGRPGITGPSNPSQPGTTEPSTPDQSDGSPAANASQARTTAPNLSGDGAQFASNSGMTTSNGSGTPASGTSLSGTNTDTNGSGADHSGTLPQTSETPTTLLLMLMGLIGLLFVSTGVVYLRHRHN